MYFGYHFDVVSSYPGSEDGTNGTSVLRLKARVRWVQAAVKQAGPYPVEMKLIYSTWT